MGADKMPDVYSEKVRFGEDSNGSPLRFHLTEVMARKKAGKLKQLFGKRLVQREIPQRSVMDWELSISGIFSGSPAQIKDFKSDLFDLYGDKHVFSNGYSDHSGSYVLKNNGIEITEPAVQGDYIIINLDLIEWNQT